jgi:acyl-coenzyme A synthetase/AMP-(fatty) acid ligase
MNIINNIFSNKNKIAIVTDNQEITYKELEILVNKMANNLISKGYKGKSILLQDDNTLGLAILWLAIIKLGGAPLIVSKLHTLNQINNFIEQVDIEIIISSNNISQLLTELNNFESHCDTVDCNKKDICLYTLSSGTTKEYSTVVSHTQESTIFAAQTGINCFEATANDVYYGTANLAFSLGLAYGLVTSLYSGATTLLLSKKSVLETLEIINKYKVTLFFSSPLFYKEASKNNITNLCNSLRYCVSGGDILNEDLRANWKNSSNKYLTNIMGTADSLFLFVASKEGITPNNSLGKLLPGYKADIINGKLNITSPFKTFVTGDFAKLIDDNLYYLGRADDLIITFHGKVHPSEIEDIISKSGIVKDVFALPYKKMGATFVKLLVVKNEKTTEETLRDFCKKNLPYYLIPKKIKFVDSLKRTFSGKPQRGLSDI